MKGFLNLLAKAKLIELSEDERQAASAEPLQGIPMAGTEALAEAPEPPLHAQASGEPAAAPAASALPSLAEACPDLDGDALEGHAFEDIFAAAGVPVSPYPAEKLLRLLDGLRAMDAGTRKMAVLAMDVADDNWQISDCLSDADLKIAALEDHKRQLAAQLQDRERQSTELVHQIRQVLDEGTAAIRKQIAELEQLLEREVTRAAQETTSVEAGLRAARESAARETRRVDAEIDRLREIPTTFKAPGAAH
ncbi:MAG: methyl-accepting chemotaxis protein [Candidatus Accumulibacter sp.]|nr:methyl-accepting chemotaxis protein [Accumulibacter sp.]